MRKLDTKTLVVASHNKGKLREIADLVAPYDIEIKSALELDLHEPEETGTTFEANAYLKAHAAAKTTGLPALSDDSGFCVKAINDDPGLYSARWAGVSKDFNMAMRNVIEKLQAANKLSGKENTGAYFVSVICLAWPDGHAEYFRGEVHGEAVWPPRGDQGFGYDPMFQPEGETRTFAEMSAEEKHGNVSGDPLSHRSRAFKLFVDQCLQA